MQQLQSTLLPAPGQPAALYLLLKQRRGKGALRHAQGGSGLALALDQGETLSTDTLFGSFYAGYWAAFTALQNLAVVVAFRGHGEVRVYEDDGGEDGAALLCRYELEAPSARKFLVPVNPAGLDAGAGGARRASRLYVEIQALKGSEVQAIDFMSEDEPLRDVSLSIGISTHNDASSRIGALLPAVLRLAAADAAVRAVYLVNHGPGLPQAEGPGAEKLRLLAPADAEAPGGLSQTLAVARSAPDAATHHLLLADDQRIDERLIPRALAFLRYARTPLVLGGTMLDAHSPAVLVGAGAVIGASGAFRQVGAETDVTQEGALALFAAPPQVDLPCWWYAILPLDQALDMPLPKGAYLRGDDLACYQALQVQGLRGTVLPGLAGWRNAALALPAGAEGAATVDLGNRYLPPHSPRPATSRSTQLNVLQSTFFPAEGLPETLYLRVTPTRPRGGLLPRRTADGRQAIRLDAEDILSTDTYFGGFYRAYWHAYAGLKDVTLAVELNGAASIKVFEDHGRGVSVLSEVQLRSAGRQRFLIDVVPSVLDLTAGETEPRASRIFLEVEAESATDLHGIDFVTWAAPLRKATLSIGLCTFNQETYFARTLARVALLARENDAVRAVHVVNQGATFKSTAIRALLEAPKIQLVDQRNLGGCGGFTRSLVEELAAPEPASHHLMMDDDIVLDERMISRAIRFLDYANREIALGAGMLDSMRPNFMYEAGAFLRTDNTIHPYCHNVDLSDPGKLWHFNTPVKTDYNAWWFCILPVEKARELQLPAPVFIRGDDFEYGQRLARAGVPTVTLPAIGVWHEPFYAKPTGWQNYYDLRNRLIFGATYGERVRQLSLAHVIGLITTAILTHNYMTAELRIRAVKDFLSGPDALFGRDPEEIHKAVMALAKVDAPEKLDEGWKLIEASKGKERPTSMRGLALGQLKALLRTGFGPLRRGSIDVYVDALAHPGNTAAKAYVLTNGPRSYHLRFVPRRWRMWGLMFRTAILALRYRSRRGPVGQAWAAGIPAYRAPDYWARTFGPAPQAMVTDGSTGPQTSGKV